jgi:hypothetical protein
MDWFGKGLLVVGLALMTYGVWGIYQAELVTDYLYLLVFKFEAWKIVPGTTDRAWFEMTMIDWIALIAGFYAVLIGKNSSEPAR